MKQVTRKMQDNQRLNEKTDFLQLNLGHRVLAHDLLMEWLSKSSKEWICCMQEPYLSNRGVPRLLARYGAYWSTKNSKEGGRIRAMIIMPRRICAYQLSQHSNTDEIYIQIEGLNLCVVSIYCSMNVAMSEILENLENVRKEKRKMIICMDSNAYNFAWGATRRSMEKSRKNWRQTMRGKYLHEFMDENRIAVCNITPHLPTFVRREDNKTTGTSHIDVTACTVEVMGMIDEWTVQETQFLTDHNPILFQYGTVKEENCEKEAQRRKGFPWKKPTDKMKVVMHEQLEKNVKYKMRVSSEEDIDKFIEIHGDEVRRVLHGVFKERKGDKKVYWWSTEVEEAHKRLKRARRRMRRYKYNNLKIEFNECRRTFRKIVNRAKGEAWKNFLADIKSPWEGLMRVIRATEAGKVQTRTLADLKGHFANDMRQTLQLLGNQFYPTPAPLNLEQAAIENIVEKQLGTVFDNGPDITIHELRFALTQVSLRSAPGEDEITNNITCMLASQKYENIYLCVLNKCLCLSYFPRAWKKALITLIPKPGGNMDNVKAFRPISLTSVYAKMFERILLMRLHFYLRETGNLAENQHAYRRGKSTQTALFEMFEMVQCAINKRGGGVCVVVFLDISGAFDRTWHAGILHKLLMYNVPVYMVSIIKSYLENRSVHFSEGGSDYNVDLSQGCPQGGILSPVLWNVLFNELLKLPMETGRKKTNRLKIIGYADDAALVCKADTVEEASSILNTHLEKILDWSTKNRVVFNAAKLAVLTISNRQNLVSPASVYYNGILINQVTHYKYLGLTVDNKLNWKLHIEGVIERLDKITRSLRSVSNVDWGLKINIFRTLYKTIFYPVMTYGISIWGWKAAQKTVYAKFDKEIRKFGLISTRCMKSTSTVYLRSLLNTQSFEDILITEVLSVSVRQFHITHTERQQTYDSYTKSIKRIEYPQCIDHHYMMCRRSVQMNFMDVNFDDSAAIHDIHPARWPGNDCVITNRPKAIWEGNNQSGLNIYTDASASSYGKGWSFVVYRHGFRIAQRKGSAANCNVYQVELLAIRNAMRYVNEEANVSNEEIVEIRTDCQSAVQMMKKYVQFEKLQKEIYDELRKASENLKNVRIRWVPGHNDIIGNDDADRLAKEAVDSAVGDQMKKTQGVIKNLIQQKRKNDIHKDWLTVSSHTRAMLPTIKDVHNFVRASPSSSLCQIISGHTRLNDFVCTKLKLINSAKCKCGASNETVSHYLFDCVNFDEIRHRIWPDFSPDYTFITQDWGKLRKYVEEMGRFKGRPSNEGT